MSWTKLGRIYKPERCSDWMVSHAQVPTVEEVSDQVLRIYFGTRDELGRTVTTCIEVEAGDPRNLLYVHDRPVLGLGRLGCFDDSGVMPSWIVEHGGRKYLYYVGWNVGTTVPYRNSIGVAVSGGGRSFERLFEGPVLDRSSAEPHFTGACCVLVEGGIWRMWYQSTTKWEVHDGRPEPFYHIKYAESEDGFEWKRDGAVSVDLRSSREGGITRPCVVKEGDLYRMWYCVRGISDYRTDRTQSYRIGYAESKDGNHWVRKDGEAGIDVSSGGWDSEMIAYPFVCPHQDRKYLFYNGNGFGKEGLGCAVDDSV